MISPAPDRARLIAGTARLGYRAGMGRGAIILTAMLALAGSSRAGSTRCWIDQGAVVAAASFGDMAGDFIIDVGAPVSELHVTRANEDGIEGDSAVRPLVLAGHRVAAARLAVVDLDALPQTDTSIAGIIGADILSRRPVTIAFAPCRLTWGEAAWPRGSRRLPITLHGGVPTIEGEVSDGARARREPMIVSTGRTESLVDDAALSRAPSLNAFAPVRLRAVVIGGVLREQVPAGVADRPPGSIGTAVWRGWKAIRLEWRRKTLELK